jgi:two-component system response regulator YesN
MLKAMLVDDERIALEGLRLLIDWRGEGFAVCAECLSAAEALALLPSAKPDLIVTDIRMAGMDGLALMAAARARGYAGEFVVVSGYGDFAYAQQALKIGVAGYLLKPVEPAEAAATLEHVRERLFRREADSAATADSLQSKLAVLLGGQRTPPEGLPAGRCWRLGTWGAPLPLDAVRAVLAAFPPGAATAHIVEDKEFLVLCWPQGEAEPMTRGAETVLAAEGRQLSLGAFCDDPAELPRLRAALAARLAARAERLNERAVALAEAIALRNAEECVAQSAELERLCDACGANARARVRMRLVAACGSLLAGRPEALAAFLAAQQEGFRTLSLLAVGLLTPVAAQISGQVIAYAEIRLAEHLTLEVVARALSYNATYLGRVFRDEQGMGFREWLNRRRIERAAQLLQNGDDVVYLIAEQVGYQHYKRFLTHFKHRYGMPPEQYRRQSGKTAKPPVGQ